MDDVFVGVLAIMAIAFAATIAVALAAAVLAATMAGTTVWALGKGFGAFGSDFRTSVIERGGERRKPRAPEPAFEIYVLGQVFADYQHGLEHAAGVLGEERQKLGVHAAKYRQKATMPISYGIIIGGYVGTALAGVLGAIAGLIVGMVVAIAAGISWLLIWILRAADAVRRRVRHASYECPTDHERFSLPVYVCPACGAEHKRLVPGRWGILKRECECGKTALPTTVIKGRQRVPQRCPSGHSMSGFLGFAENLPIAIVGGPSAGKSTFLAGALVELEDPKAGVSIEPLSESRDAYARLIDAMRAGVPPEKTVDEQRPALVAEIQGSGRSRALYAYDLAGEVYQAEDKVRGLRFLARSAGIVMLVDPFSIRNVADDRAEELKAQAAQVLPSTEDPMRVYERLLATLKEAGADTAHMPIAIVIAKSDALGIEEEIAKLTATAGGGERQWLEDNGAGNLVRSIEQDFKQIGWFSASALGRMPDQSNTTPFVPRGALAPLLWILARRDITPSADASTATHTAQQLIGTATDFPPPSAAARKRSATIVALAASLLLLAVPVVLASTAGSNSGVSAASALPSGGGSSEPSSAGGSPTSTGSTEPTGTTSSEPAPTYPLMRPEDAQPVRSSPSESAGEVGKIEPNTQVSIVCTVQGESIENDTIWDKISSPEGYVSDTSLNTGTHSAVAAACPGASANSGAPPAESAAAHVLHEHLERLGNGEYQAAFALFSSSYQSSAAGWVANREDGDPVIHVIRIGKPSYGNGGNSARLYVLFYAKDRNDSEGSDTHCRRFAGIAEVIKEDGQWRYEPNGDSLSSTVELEDDRNCQS